MTPPPNSGDEPRKPDDDPLGGMDPMAWLESLARRQGANPDELVTGGNMEIPVPPAENADSDAAIEAALAGVSPDESSAPSATPDTEASGALEDLTGGVDPMAWLESLARRQGASPDELITGGDVDLPEPEVPAPEGEIATDSFELMAESEIVDGNDPLAWLSEMAESGDDLDELAAAMSESTAPAGASADDPLGGMDPMAWLESLARRQGASPDELVTGGALDLPPEEEAEGRPTEEPMIEYVDQRDFEMVEEVAAPDELSELGELTYEAEMESAPEPLATADGLDGNDPMAWLSELAEGGDLDTAAPETPEPAAAEIPGGMDPMAWLESLARRQGASPDELVTGGTLELPPETEAVALPELDLTPESDFQLDLDSTLAEIEAEGEATTEPLFPLPSVPYDLPDMTFPEETEEIEDFQPAEAFEGEQASMLPEEEEAAETTEAAVLETADLAAGMDPMAWLESLARRQGANPDELVTGGTLDLPPEPDVQPAEPGYSGFDPFAATTFGGRAEYPETGEPEAEVTEEMSVLAEVDPLAWLETLTGTAGIDLGSLDSYATPVAEPEEQTMAPESALSWLQSLTTEQMEEATPAAQATPSVVEDVMAGGLSDDVEEIRAWLETQARHLEEAGIEPEALPVEEGDTEPVPGEIPDWLSRMRPSSETAPETPPLTDAVELPELPSDLPGWLAAAEPGTELPDLEAELARLENADLAAAFAPEPTRMPPELEVLTEPPSPDEIDSWAEALDEEFEREQAGDESIPDWYLEALQRAEAEIRGVPPPEPAAPAESAVVAEMGESVEPVEPSEPQIEIVTGSEAEMPAWLRAPLEDMAPSEPVLDGSIPGWLDELALEASPEPALSELAQPLMAKPQETVTADEAEAEMPYPPIPAEEDVRPPWLQPVHEPVRRPAEPPAAMPSREWRDMPVALSQARQWVQQGQLQPALEQYQTLVDSAQLLEETRADLRTLAEQNPTEPKVFRLLGDTYMRLGDLQAALDTYLSALDQL